MKNKDRYNLKELVSSCTVGGYTKLRYKNHNYVFKTEKESAALALDEFIDWLESDVYEFTKGEFELLKRLDGLDEEGKGTVEFTIFNMPCVDNRIRYNVVSEDIVYNGDIPVGSMFSKLGNKKYYINELILNGVVQDEE